MRGFRLAAVLLATLALAAADVVRREAVAFPDGATEATLSGSVRGYDSVEYTVSAGAGQDMAVTLATAHPMLAMNVFAPGDVPGASTALFNGARSGTDFKAALAAAGDYTIQVFLIRAAARRGEAADYSLTVAVTGTARPEAPETPDAAPEASRNPPPAAEAPGGRDPDRWQVTADSVTVRAVPADDGSAVAVLVRGGVVRNLGCRADAGTRWCLVEQTEGRGARGWVAGTDLRAAPGDAAPAGDATSGVLPCAFRSAQTRDSCPFDADPRGGGNATVTVTRPDGQQRRITFQSGRAVASNLGAGARLTTTRRGSTTLVGIGAERYEVPDGAIWGG